MSRHRDAVPGTAAVKSTTAAAGTDVGARRLEMFEVEGCNQMKAVAKRWALPRWARAGSQMGYERDAVGKWRSNAAIDVNLKVDTGESPSETGWRLKSATSARRETSQASLRGARGGSGDESNDTASDDDEARSTKTAWFSRLWHSYGPSAENGLDLDLGPGLAGGLSIVARAVHGGVKMETVDQQLDRVW
ncbi:hypothetical protein FDECE_4291 [Fusarium decemcellulare]|nr:hypothetical protein FDECE_4291 [Fusarium decemcellulare]